MPRRDSVNLGLVGQKLTDHPLVTVLRAPEHRHSLPTRPARPIVLVGLMGAGKTTVGQRLASRLGLRFVDTDHEIERAANLTIAELFDRYGESEFRDGERRVIARLVDEAPQVIATGGGAFMNDLTRALVLQRGHVVWLDADIDVLAARTARRPGQRPLLRERDAREVLAELAAIRNPVYSMAHVHVRNQSGRHEIVVNAIVQAIRGGI